MNNYHITLSNYEATFSLHFAKSDSNSRLKRKMDVLIKKKPGRTQTKKKNKVTKKS